jgi:hypothetical protein
MCDDDINESLPEQDSMPRIMTMRFSAIRLRTPLGTLATIDAPSMPPFCTPCAPIARANATQRASR